MLHSADCGLLFVFCFLQLCFVPADFSFLSAFLSAVIAVCGKSLLCFDRDGSLCVTVYLLFTFFCPTLSLFLPAVCYLPFSVKKPWLGLSGLIPACIHIVFGNLSFFSFLFLSIGILSALFLSYQANQILYWKKTYLKMTDDSREHALLLKEKNKVLREKQDYEIYTATLQERNRIAREIHDNVGHLLSRSLLLVGAAKTVNQAEQLNEPLSHLESSLNQAMTSIRESVHDLHDEAMDLQSAAQDLLRDFTFCPVEFTYDMGRSIPREVKYCYLAIMKEALSNVIRHSHATQVKLLMREQPALYQLSIQDNGQGLPQEEKGIGLSNMKERVKALDGLLQIHTEHGFHIFITLPKKPL